MGTEEVKVAAGSYSCVRVQLKGAEWMPMDLSVYLAPKVGIVKLEAKDGETLNTAELQEFKSGK
jgi:hypothetical protein